MNFLIAGALGYFFNWFIRGGGVQYFILKHRTGKFVTWLLEHKILKYDEEGLPDIRFGKAINALAYGVAMACFSGVWWLFIVGAVHMAIGQSFAWGKKIGRIMDGNSLGVMQMTARGLIWGCLLAMTQIYFIGQGMNIGFMFFTVAASFTMGVVYDVLWRIFGRDYGNAWFNHWGTSEQVFGILLWLPLALL